MLESERAHRVHEVVAPEDGQSEVLIGRPGCPLHSTTLPVSNYSKMRICCALGKEGNACRSTRKWLPLLPSQQAPTRKRTSPCATIPKHLGPGQYQEAQKSTKMAGSEFAGEFKQTADVSLP